MPGIPENNCESSLLKPGTFMGCKPARDFSGARIDVAISGIPLDQFTTGRPGARLGPSAIRKASSHLSWELRRWPWDFSVFDILGIVDAGDLDFDTSDKNIILAHIQRHAFQLLQEDKIMLTFGGDHSVRSPLFTLMPMRTPKESRINTITAPCFIMPAMRALLIPGNRYKSASGLNISGTTINLRC
jgi:arginase family enzyme